MGTDRAEAAADDVRDEVRDDVVSRRADVVRLVGTLLVLAVTAALILRTGIDADRVRALVADTGWTAPGLFLLVYVAGTLLLVPGAVLTIAGGLLFGAAGGGLLTLVGATVGATLAFRVARWAGRGPVERLGGDRVATVDGWLADRGLLAVATLRLVPLVPFSLANYAAGLTGIRPRDHVVGTTLGIVPGTFAYAALGASVTDPASAQFLAAVGGLLLLAVLGVALSRRRGSAAG